MSFFTSLIRPDSLSAPAETAGLTRRPQFQIDESDAAYALTVNLPGVSKEGLEITDENGELTVVGTRSARIPEGTTLLHRESSDLPYKLVLAHDGTVDTGKIVAELRDGVLRLSLAKAESAKPRRIAVT